MVTGGPWVSTCFVQDSEFSAISDMGVQEMADHMAQWDFGDESDAAHTYADAPWGTCDREYEVTVGGLDYVLAVDYITGCASLNRRPLAELVTAGNE